MIYDPKKDVTLDASFFVSLVGYTKNGHSGEVCGLEISDTLNSYLGAAEGKAPGYAKKKTLAAQARGLIIMYFI